jgi:hypothetical protein
MGLDQYAYCSAKAGEQAEYWDSAKFNETTGEFGHATVAKPREIAYWRKHPNLQGWMKQLWESKGRPNLEEYGGGSFNGVELELTWEDLDNLEQAIIHRQLPETTGFFFGENSDEHYYDSDLAFVRQGRAEIFCGFKVFYNSSW